MWLFTCCMFSNLFSVAGFCFVFCRTTAVILAQYILMTRLNFFHYKESKNHMCEARASHCTLLSKNLKTNVQTTTCLALCLQPPDLLTSLQFCLHFWQCWKGCCYYYIFLFFLIEDSLTTWMSSVLMLCGTFWKFVRRKVEPTPRDLSSLDVLP